MRMTEAEINDGGRQQALRARAENLAAEWSEYDSVLAVLLTGSVARGPVGPSSDLDLHIISAEPLSVNIPPWRFGAEDVIENVHVVFLKELNQGFINIANTPLLADWFYRTALGDELQGCITLFTKKGCAWIEHRLRLLIARRLEGDVVKALAARHADAAKQLAMCAEQNLSAGSTLDGHQNLRFASQNLLMAALIRCGWTIRGSKKRPEISHVYCDNPSVSKTLEILEEIVGIADLTMVEASRICIARHECRPLQLQELHRLYANHRSNHLIRHRLLKEIELQTIHNASAVDYYSPLVAEGFIKGPVNHIRSLSGFPHLPSRLLLCLGLDSRIQIKTWSLHEDTSKQLREMWLGVASFCSSLPTINRWVKQVRAATELLV
jgi:hypothetical protein